MSDVRPLAPGTGASRGPASSPASGVQAGRLPPWRRQAAILTERYLDVMLGDLGTLLLLLAQAPVIALLCVVVWGDVGQDTDSLYFVLTLTAVWCGCINACREIVKERAIFARERLFGLSCSAYVLSKAKVLLALGLVQVVSLLAIVEVKIGLKGALLWQLVALILSAAAGTGLGLLISALARRQERAVAAVPLLILPQILFSEFAIPREAFGRVTEVVEQGMIVKWGYEVFTEAAATEPGYGRMVLALFVLLGMTALLHGVAVLALRLGREDRYL